MKWPYLRLFNKHLTWSRAMLGIWSRGCLKFLYPFLSPKSTFFQYVTQHCHKICPKLGASAHSLKKHGCWITHYVHARGLSYLTYLDIFLRIFDPSLPLCWGLYCRHLEYPSLFFVEYESPLAQNLSELNKTKGSFSQGARAVYQYFGTIPNSYYIYIVWVK